jgi:peptidoglycan lytic transglycosylase
MCATHRVRRAPLAFVFIVAVGCTLMVTRPLAAAPRVDAQIPQLTLPAPKSHFSEIGVASWYGKAQQGHLTADGERFDPYRLTAASRTFPFGTIVRVTNLYNGRKVKVRINDRGPYVTGRIIDMSKAAAVMLGMVKMGLIKVRIDAFKSDQGQLKIRRDDS